MLRYYQGMADEKQNDGPPVNDDLREALDLWLEWEKQHPLTPEEAHALWEALGGHQGTIDLYEKCIRMGELGLAAKMIADVTARSQHSDPGIAREYADVLARMTLHSDKPC